MRREFDGCMALLVVAAARHQSGIVKSGVHFLATWAISSKEGVIKPLSQ